MPLVMEAGNGLEALHLTLAADTAEQWAQRQPEKTEAYELYLLGRARQHKRTADDNVKAAAFFRRANSCTIPPVIRSGGGIAGPRARPVNRPRRLFRRSQAMTLRTPLASRPAS